MRKSKRNTTATDTNHDHPPPLATTAVAATEEERRPAPPSLEHIRSHSLRAQSDAARTISELEAWRAELDATIAFLKAQRK